MKRLQKSRTRCGIAVGRVLGLAGLLAGCSAEPAPEQLPARNPGADPPGAARVLSLGGGGRLEGKSEFANAVNCSAALNVAIAAVKALSQSAQAAEVRQLEAIEQRFRRRAIAARKGDGGAADADREIRRQIALGRANVPQQGQLAMTCVQSLERAPGTE